MYIERSLRPDFERLAKSYAMVAVVGPRQAGKTTFLKECLGERNSYVLLDDPDARRLFDEDIKAFEARYIEGNEVTILDEAQQCQDPGSKLKYLVDSGRKLWITSSSEVLLSEKILGYLVGRISIKRLWPFSLTEFLMARDPRARDGVILQRLIAEHVRFGGYPAVVTEDDRTMKQQRLRDLYQTMLIKDLMRVYGIREELVLAKTVGYFATNPGLILNLGNAASMLGIDSRTLSGYLDALEVSYIIFRMRPFFTNKGKEITKSPKVYFIDTGILHAVNGIFPERPQGLSFENYVISEIIKANHRPRYWRTKAKAEVDIIIETPTHLIPIEVKLKAGPGRISRSLRSFIQKYSPKMAIIVAFEVEQGEVQVLGCTIHWTDIPGMHGLIGKGPGWI